MQHTLPPHTRLSQPVPRIRRASGRLSREPALARRCDHGRGGRMPWRTASAAERLPGPHGCARRARRVCARGAGAHRRRVQERAGDGHHL